MFLTNICPNIFNSEYSITVNIFQQCPHLFVSFIYITLDVKLDPSTLNTRNNMRRCFPETSTGRNVIANVYITFLGVHRITFSQR